MPEYKRNIPTERLSVVICDDHFITRQGLVDLLSRHNISVGAEASNPEELLKVAREMGGNRVVILDLNFGGSNRLDLINETLVASPTARILVFSMWNALETIIAAYRRGALGYVTKDSDPSYLIDAVAQVADGQTYFMPGLEKQIALHVTTVDKGDPRVVLNKAELRTFIRLASGYNNEMVAEELEVSKKTIANQVSTIQNKLGCDKMQFTAVALAYGLINPDGLAKTR